MSVSEAYQALLDAKVAIAPEDGLTVDPGELSELLKPHQKDVVLWALRGGRRALFLSFGLGKTLIQLELMRLIHKHRGGRMLVVCPLGVKQEFVEEDRKSVV